MGLDACGGDKGAHKRRAGGQRGVAAGSPRPAGVAWASKPAAGRVTSGGAGWRERRQAAERCDQTSPRCVGSKTMISAIFVDRPRLAVVIAVVITIAGLLALTRIPVPQFPDIVPPQLQVSAAYPRPSPAVVQQSIGQPI